MKKKAIIFLSGRVNLKADYYKNIKYSEYDIYCADGGANHAYNLGVIPKLILGDLDSITEEARSHYKNLGVKFEKFPGSKNFTDGELILDKVTVKYKNVIILGGSGGRTDHFLTNLNLLEKYQNITYEDENEVIFWVKKDMEICGQRGKTISFIPLTPIDSLTLEGFIYPLDRADIPRSSSLCMSNIIDKENVRIKYDNGSVIGIIQK
ncbi:MULTISPECIES: thiamine diphosphokinase [Psychrilyobacter]|uniref:thiamine diphosphokinase n=1 Tax=Psychrilyobacter TaxID=623282 RepID=UPI0013146D74|nr:MULTISPECIES: thiamine diphosphokinase [Psychrilyobacter]MCS5422811.1 thiamine diphosphokinase [Psychrilyobacter sp. S5]NDI76847.1 thiamine diphosphokinase [Psychrilyobacter piezotolerans]